MTIGHVYFSKFLSDPCAHGLAMTVNVVNVDIMGAVKKTVLFWNVFPKV